MSHNPTPWTLETGTNEDTREVWAQVIDKDRKLVLYDSDYEKSAAVPVILANFKRIVACVNACEAFTTDVLEKVGVIDKVVIESPAIPESDIIRYFQRRIEELNVEIHRLHLARDPERQREAFMLAHEQKAREKP